MRRALSLALLPALVACGRVVPNEADAEPVDAAVDATLVSDVEPSEDASDTRIDDWDVAEPTEPDTTTGDTSPPDLGPCFDAAEAGDAELPPPTVKLLSGSCTYDKATSCTNSGKCTGVDACIEDCNACFCTSTSGSWRCTDSICPTSAGCPTRIPGPFGRCTGDCVCEYESGCPGKPHRAECKPASIFGNHFFVTYSSCPPTCPRFEPAVGGTCWTENTLCSYRLASCDYVDYLCELGRWRTLPRPTDSTLWKCDKCAPACPAGPPGTGDSCGPDFKVGEFCYYTIGSSTGRECICTDNRWYCWMGSSSRLPGFEASPNGRCASAPWCAGFGECCGSWPKLDGGKWPGCDCHDTGMICGEGEGC